MPSTIHPASPQNSHVIVPNKKFRTVLGFGPLFRDSSDTDTNSAFRPRKSVDTARSYSYRKKPRADRLSIATTAFFEPQQNQNLQSQNSPAIPVVDHNRLPSASEDMTVESATHPHPSRRPPMRMDTQDGPWSVSVAETPRDARSYSLYIKTPTHNLTLTRTAMEIVELDHKLRDAHPGTTIPTLPIDALALPTPPPKRKSTFLNTLSRLASPTAKSGRTTARRSNNASVSISTGATPLTSPSTELGDPFTSFANATGEDPVVPAPSANSTGVAAYLTTISNTPALRQARVWKRFVRVRTDDLESVRVERAIKRVRSDVAVHVGLDKEVCAAESVDLSAAPSEAAIVGDEETVENHTAVVANGSAHATAVDLTGEAPKAYSNPEADAAVFTKALDQAEVKEKEEEETKGEETIATKEPPATKLSDVPPSPAAEQAPESPLPPPPPTELPARMQRSQSADPDKSSRISRAFASSTPTDTASQTEDESSVSTTSARKKRARSSDPLKEGRARRSQRKVVIDDFEMMRVLGKGCAGKVLLVKHKSTADLYALKAITKRHVLAHQELQHTLTEQAVLKRMAAESKDPFVVKLWWSFHDKENLFLVMDFHPGGDLATQLARWGRLGRDRARFYAAEIVEGVEGLHAAGVIYRDLKPENILIGADGHIVLTDFGLSKEFPRRTTAITAPSTPLGSRTEFYAPASPGGTTAPATPPWMKADKGGELASGWPGQPVGQSDATSTFCGTAEYLAPEVIQGLPYSYEVDWWSFGTMLYEMLTGITPFWANNHSDMYVRVLQDELQFPDDRAIDQDTKSLIRGLLQRNPGLRMCEPRIKRHPYFSMIDWSHVYYKRYIPPYIPPIDPSNASDTQNFDDTFLDMEPVLDDFNETEQLDTDQEPEQTDTDRTGTDGDESNTTPSQSRSSSIRPQPQPALDELVDVFDGYSFKGRHSVLIDGDSEEESASEEEEDSSIHKELEAETLMVAEEPRTDVAAPEEEVPEPKTPEARPVVTLDIPEPVSEVPVDEPDTPAAASVPTAEPPLPPTPVEATPRKSKELPSPTVQEPIAPILPEKTPPPKAVPRPANGRATRPRREKSGVPALDKYLSDHADEDNNLTEREDDEDDDWDIVEAADGEDRNGAKGTSLFARGVVDRYRLAVFRKASTPTQRPVPRSVSGMSKDSEVTGSESADSPSPTQRRGRNPGLGGFRKQRQFLGPKTPPSSFSSKSSRTAKSLSQSNSNTLSAASTASSGGFLTPSPSLGGMPESPSLKSKESAISVGTRSMSSDQSGNGEPSPPAPERVKAQTHEEPEKYKNKKLKKYKENAEKVFSLFSSPRQPS